eukprot:TRINITY_DN4733_c0_g3_i1.p1 TRINITY_DN4733_c0_g3~~TRINITY_DN4733_c0_g3_i1.p1  ORF type:complete len:290 (-),score=82.25 TRINITY_DN4733_c0_g3_i1:180-1049(-)
MCIRDRYQRRVRGFGAVMVKATLVFRLAMVAMALTMSRALSHDDEHPVTDLGEGFAGVLSSRNFEGEGGSIAAIDSKLSVVDPRAMGAAEYDDGAAGKPHELRSAPLDLASLEDKLAGRVTRGSSPGQPNTEGGSSAQGARGLKEHAAKSQAVAKSRTEHAKLPPRTMDPNPHHDADKLPAAPHTQASKPTPAAKHQPAPAAKHQPAPSTMSAAALLERLGKASEDLTAMEATQRADPNPNPEPDPAAHDPLVHLPGVEAGRSTESVLQELDKQRRALQQELENSRADS